MTGKAIQMTGKAIQKWADESNSAEYQRKHRAMRKVRGRARDHDCVDCGAQAHDWSQVHETNGEDPIEHYEPRCRSCHQKYDCTDEKRQAVRDRLTGSVHSKQSRENMSLAHAYGDGSTCKRGHDLSNPENVRKNRGPRSCAECHREDSRSRRLANAQ